MAARVIATMSTVVTKEARTVFMRLSRAPCYDKEKDSAIGA
jgi:hypothetical protein